MGSTFALLAFFFFFALPPFCRPHKSVQKSLQIPLGAEGGAAGLLGVRQLEHVAQRPAVFPWLVGAAPDILFFMWTQARFVASFPRAGPSLQGWAAFSHPLFSYCLITKCACGKGKWKATPSSTAGEPICRHPLFRIATRPPVAQTGFALEPLWAHTGWTPETFLGQHTWKFLPLQRCNLHGRGRPWIRVCGVQCFLSF